MLNYGKLTTDLSIDISSFMNHASYAAQNMKIILYNGDLDSTATFVGGQLFAAQLSSGSVRLKEELFEIKYSR